MNAAAAPPLFTLDAVHHTYANGQRGLADCSLHIARGSRTVLLGANGCGKTTLLLHLNGLLRASSGRLLVDGAPLAHDRASLDALRRRVGLVFQNPERQVFSASVAEDVAFGPLNLGLPAAAVRARVAQALAAVGMGEYADAAVHQVSFGQQKRVCLAGVLAMEPEVLLLDEPMAGLDAALQHELEQLFSQLAARGATLVLSSHDVDFAFRWASDIHLLADGRCLASLAAGALPAHAAALAAAGQPLPAVVALHNRLSARGVLPATPVPRSLAALLAQLDSPVQDSA